MKATGITRKIDSLGRFVIPMEVRKNLGVDVGDMMEIFIDKDLIALKKYSPGCVICGNIHNIVMYKGKRICKDCIDELEKTV